MCATKLCMRARVLLLPAVWLAQHSLPCLHKYVCRCSWSPPRNIYRVILFIPPDSTSPSRLNPPMTMPSHCTRMHLLPWHQLLLQPHRPFYRQSALPQHISRSTQICSRFRIYLCLHGPVCRCSWFHAPSNIYTKPAMRQCISTY